MKLTCIDTFSGIGGIALGLRDFVSPLLYCDVDPYCQSVLLERMKDGDLDKAPIHNDIKNLYISEHMNPDMICGGFPCQDISTIGLRKGIVNGNMSNMFYEIMRIVDECPSIQYIFLENVSNILNCGMKEVVDECTKRGFNLQWLVKSARSMGAPHLRERWFCLACKPGADLSSLCLEPDDMNVWTKEPHKRVTFKPDIKEDNSYDPNWVTRCQTLGNTAVPCVVRAAFVELARASHKWSEIGALFQEYSTNLYDMTYPFPESGLIYNSSFYSIPSRKLHKDKKHHVSITINDDKTLDNFPTPRRGVNHAATLTERTMRDLPTVLVQCKESLDYVHDHDVVSFDKITDVVIPNVNYIEWMMGFPKDWTKVNTIKEKKGTKTVKNNLNGYHIFIKETHKGDVKSGASKWRELSIEEKKVYSTRARELSQKIAV